MKQAISDMRTQARRTDEKVKAVAVRRGAQVSATAAPMPALPSSAIPVGATPTFVTLDKKFQFGAITITPGGYVAAENIFRSRTMQSDINTSWNNIPTLNNGLAHLGEDKLTARGTHLALLAEGSITPQTVVAGYGEFDFQGAGVQSNNNQSYSYLPRIRNLYATFDSGDYGFHLLAGQNWSLVTLNSKGITPRNEVTPPSIDSGYVTEFQYTRAPNNGLCGNVVSNNSTTPTSTTGLGATPALGIAGSNCLAVGTGGSFGQQGVPTQCSLKLRRTPRRRAVLLHAAQPLCCDDHANGIGTTAAPLVSAKTSDHIVETSLRYYPFQ